MSEQKQLRATVYGLVQGVGFRWHTRQAARRLGLRGYVRNRPDRSVEVVAEGPEHVLRQFVSYLESGPPAAVVDRVDVRWSLGTGRYHGFEVRF